MGHVSKKNKTSAGRLFGRSVIYGADDGKETPYMTRYWIGRLRLHLFHRGDQDPDCHDHPWGFWTFPFRSYVEEVAIPFDIQDYADHAAEDGDGPAPLKFKKKMNLVRAFRLHYRPATYCHRVIGPWAGNRVTSSSVHLTVPGTIPTLVWTEKASRRWGFLKARDGRWCWVHWKEYVFAGGKDAPCSEPDYMTLPVEEYDALFRTNGAE